MNIDQIIAGMEAHTPISDITSTRIFYRNPLDQPSAAYLTLLRQARGRTEVADENRFRIVAFSKTMSELDTLATAIIDFFEARNIVGTDTYYKIEFITQLDSIERLNSGFYFNALTFNFRKTT